MVFEYKYFFSNALALFLASKAIDHLSRFPVPSSHRIKNSNHSKYLIFKLFLPSRCVDLFMAFQEVPLFRPSDFFPPQNSQRCNSGKQTSKVTTPGGHHPNPIQALYFISTLHLRGCHPLCNCQPIFFSLCGLHLGWLVGLQLKLLGNGPGGGWVVTGALWGGFAAFRNKVAGFVAWR